MKLEALKKNSLDTLAAYEAEVQRIRALEESGEINEEETSLLDWFENVEDAKKILHLCNEVYPNLSEEEINRLKAIPSYKIDGDIRDLKDIKDRHGISWNEMRILIRAMW